MYNNFNYFFLKHTFFCTFGLLKNITQILKIVNKINVIYVFSVLFLSIFIRVNVSAQIVNIEDKRSAFADSIGWFETGNLSGQWKKNKSEIFSVKAGFQVEFQFKKRILLSISKINFSRINKKNYINEGFQHLRYTKLLTKRIGYEAYGQAQYNEQLSLRLRLLFGTGLRYKICSNKEKCNLGLSLMYEYDEESTEKITQRDFRISSYFSMAISFSDNIKLYSTSYYQPLINKFNDFRFSSQSKLVMAISKRLSATITFSILYDSRAPLDTPSLSEDMYGGLRYKF